MLLSQKYLKRGSYPVILLSEELVFQRICPLRYIARSSILRLSQISYAVLEVSFIVMRTLVSYGTIKRKIFDARYELNLAIAKINECNSDIQQNKMMVIFLVMIMI